MDDELFTKDYFHTKGVRAEKVVHDLATKTFLIDWCFLNPKLSNGKELCDLLVVFDDIAIIWQVKDLKLDENGKYNESEVNKNIRQLSGARRQLFDIKTSIRLENARRTIETFDASLIKEIFLISVLLGEGEELYSFIDEIKNSKVHIFTRDFTKIVLNELDTVSDFVEYLKEKEQFISKDKSLIVMGGEEEFLAYYLMNDRNFKDLERADNIMIQDGSWEYLQSKPEYIAKKREDRISYGWDGIINRTHEGSNKYEVVARELARLNRFQRRYLSKVFFEAHVFAHNDKVHDLFRRMMPSDGTTYCFLFQGDFKSRDKRKKMLEAICYVAREKYPQNKKVLGIATEMKFKPTCSYDFVLLDFPVWTREWQEYTDKLREDIGIFKNPVIGYVHDDEYPKIKSKGDENN